MAYCLLGIFDVHIAMIYGEGERHARRRVELEIRNKEREEQELGLDQSAHRRRVSPVGDAERPPYQHPRSTTRKRSCHD